MHVRSVMVLLATLVVATAQGCASDPPTPAPDIGATVEAMVEAKLAEQANNVPPNPDLAKDYYNRAGGYFNAGEYQLAIEDFGKAIQLGVPNLQSYAYGNRGYAYYALGQYQQAIQDFDKAIQVDPDYAEAYNNRGVSYKSLGQTVKAQDDFDKACSLDSRFC